MHVFGLWEKTQGEIPPRKNPRPPRQDSNQEASRWKATALTTAPPFQNLTEITKCWCISQQFRSQLKLFCPQIIWNMHEPKSAVYAEHAFLWRGSRKNGCRFYTCSSFSTRLLKCEQLLLTVYVTFSTSCHFCVSLVRRPWYGLKCALTAWVTAHKYFFYLKLINASYACS